MKFKTYAGDSPIFLAFKTTAQKVGKEWQGVVELHLFVVECKNKCD